MKSETIFESEKQKVKVKKKLKHWKPKAKVLFILLFHHFFPPFHNRIVWTTQKFHFESYSTGTSEIFGKKWKWKVLSEKRKNFWKWKAKSKSGKIIEKLKAKFLILKTVSEKQKRKFYDFAFQFCSQSTTRRCLHTDA